MISSSPSFGRLVTVTDVVGKPSPFTFSKTPYGIYITKPEDSPPGKSCTKSEDVFSIRVVPHDDQVELTLVANKPQNPIVFKGLYDKTKRAFTSDEPKQLFRQLMNQMGCNPKKVKRLLADLTKAVYGEDYSAKKTIFN